MDYGLNLTNNIPLLKERDTSLDKSEMSNAVPAVQESLVNLKRSRRPEAYRRSTRKKGETKIVQDKNEEVGGGGGDEEKAEVERKIVALQKLVPGGEALGVDKLFEETAYYILALQSQIKAMRLLASFLQGLEKDKGKFGA